MRTTYTSALLTIRLHQATLIFHGLLTGAPDLMRLGIRMVLLALASILFLLAWACGSDETSQDAPFRIGVMESLTGAG